jgi:hypothetical protein
MLLSHGFLSRPMTQASTLAELLSALPSIESEALIRNTVQLVRSQMSHNGFLHGLLAYQSSLHDHKCTWAHGAGLTRLSYR